MQNIKNFKFDSGLSILEVVISALILLLLMTIAANIMYASLKVSREESGIAFIRKEALKAMEWLIKDLRRTHGASFIYNMDPATDVSMGMGFLTTMGNDPNGTEPTQVIASPLWKGYIIYYLKKDPKNPATVETNQLYIMKRRLFFPEDPYYQPVFSNILSLARPLKDTDLSYICTEPSEGEPVRIIARNIYQISIIEDEANYITLTVETRDKSAKEKGTSPGVIEISATYTSRVLMRNTILQSH